MPEPISLVSKLKGMAIYSVGCLFCLELCNQLVYYPSHHIEFQLDLFPSSYESIVVLLFTSQLYQRKTCSRDIDLAQ